MVVQQGSIVVNALNQCSYLLIQALITLFACSIVLPYASDELVNLVLKLAAELFVHALKGI